MILFLLSCTSSDVERPSTLSKERLLRRVSLDTRGILPSLEEYESLQTGSSTIEDFTNAFLQDPNFQEHLVYRFADIWHTRVDSFDIVADDFDLDPSIWWIPFGRAVGEEPLRLMAHIAAADLPWTEIVTSELVMTNDLLVNIFPVEYEDGSEPIPKDALNPSDITSWSLGRYLDGRPAVGILSTNGLWWRYPTDSFNMNRTRAALITKMLLCDDYLERPIDFSAGNNILEDTESAIRQDPACLTCHSSLDPLASSMFGFWWVEQFNPLEATYYHPERELMGEEMIKVAPSWFGEPVMGFAEIGERIAADNRFHQCTVRQAREMLYNREQGAVDFPDIADMTSIFKERFSYQSLWKEILLSEEYQQLPTEQHPIPTADRMLSPYQLEKSLEELTGYSWTKDNIRLMDVEFRTIMGGVDGFQSFEQQRRTNLSATVVVQRIVEALVARAMSNPKIDTLFAELDVNQYPHSSHFEEFFSKLKLKVHGIPADIDWMTSTSNLWYAVFEASNGNSFVAWEVTIQAVLQDADFVRY